MKAGKVTFKYKNAYWIKYFWLDNENHQLYSTDTAYDSEDFYIPTPTGFKLQDLEETFDYIAEVHSVIKSPKTKGNGYEQFYIHFEVKELNLKAGAIYETGVNYDGGKPQSEENLYNLKLNKEALINE